LCLWSQLPTNEFNLLRITPQQLQTLSINQNQNTIQADATTSTKFGHFLWANPSYYPQIQAQKATSIVSETLFNKNYINGACFIFMYIINGNNPGVLNVYRKQLSSANKTLEFSIQSNQLSDFNWRQASVPLKSIAENFEIYIEVLIGDTYGNIAIDDIYLLDSECVFVETTPNPGATFDCGDGNFVSLNKVCNFIKECPNGNDEVNCGDCDFESSLCEYKDISDGKIEWERVQAVASANGPSVDNTLSLSSGHYIEVDDSKNSVEFIDFAVIKLNRLLKPCSSACELEFYYHLFGMFDELSVYIIYEESTYSKLFELKGAINDDLWNRVLIPIGRISKPFTLEFNAFKNEFDNDYSIAIDDIKFRNCQFPPQQDTCPIGSFTCARKACIPMNKVCDLVDDCGDNSDELNCQGYTACDFEDGLCDWQNDPGSSLKWILKTGISSIYETGPKRDHTTGTPYGQYLVMKSENQLAGNRVRLLSSIFKIDQALKCDLRVFYHMYGRNMGALSIYSRTSTDGGENLLFRKANEVGNYWDRIDLIINETKPFQIIIEGVVGSGRLGDIGIDDLSFSNGCIVDNSIVLPSLTTLQPQTTLSPCPNQFKCKSNNQCVPLDKVCNFKYECDDRSDEAECGTCDFETSSCGWYDRSDDKFVWKRKQAPSINNQGPQADHTFGDGRKGFFLITEIDENNGEYVNYAELHGPKFQETSFSCKMDVWINMGRSTDPSIYFYYANFSDSDDFDKISNIGKPLGDGWHLYDLNIGRYPSNYHLEVNAWIDYEDESSYFDVAFDDIEFIDCSDDLVVNKPLDCDFDNSFCYYYKDFSADFAWTRDDGNPFSSIGPAFDHTTGTGYYAVMDPRYPHVKGDKARFLSSLQTSLDQNGCFSFWYLMYGADVDTLNVYVISSMICLRQALAGRYCGRELVRLQGNGSKLKKRLEAAKYGELCSKVLLEKQL
jgi:hypothetical protein